ncbi:hypothetical protein MPL1032_20446 [Mesorhizobium plurifarium]|uniref:Uncharacterized protein n=1 Tax=Mesorhizobium plurifarium TaxID=69974 RepID=A0A0K2VXL5_MESPL|nr:hypothetical protein MPL1032_20446 [Mesorhizobium plurifarium]
MTARDTGISLYVLGVQFGRAVCGGGNRLVDRDLGAQGTLKRQRQAVEQQPRELRKL